MKFLGALLKNARKSVAQEDSHSSAFIDLFSFFRPFAEKPPVQPTAHIPVFRQVQGPSDSHAASRRTPREARAIIPGWAGCALRTILLGLAKSDARAQHRM